MARMHTIALTLLGLSFSAGCVDQTKYDALKLERDQLREQLATADGESKAAHQGEEAYKQQLQQLMNGGATKDGIVKTYIDEIAALRGQNEDLKSKYDEALRNTGKTGGALPPPLASALTEFAAQNPDLVDFDSSRGMVKFKSDVTFALGKSELTDNARKVIDRFAQILGSPAANGYELMIAGHTDSTQVSNPATIAAGNKDNWYLSAHRAIAVGEELQRQRIDSRRIAVVGYADQRPISSNAAQNRRVEVLILPTTVTAHGSGVAQLGKAGGTVKISNVNKDSAPLEPVHPKFNK